MKNKIFIQVGKFQTPNTAFHKGHLAVTKAIIDKMNSSDLLYVSVASRGKAILFDKDTTIAIIREIIRPLKNDNILVGSLDNNWLFGMYNVTKKLAKLDEEEFKSEYIKRVHDFIGELNKTSLVDLNKYEIVLVTGKEDDRGLVYTHTDDLFKMNRNFEENSDYPIQYYNIDLVMDDSGKVSSSTLRKEGKVLTCKDVWDNIDNSLCEDIDANINKIVQNAPKVEESNFSIFEGLFDKFKNLVKKKPLDKSMYDGHKIIANTTPRIVRDKYLATYDEGKDLYTLTRVLPRELQSDSWYVNNKDGKGLFTFSFDELHSKMITKTEYPDNTDDGTFIDGGIWEDEDEPKVRKGQSGYDSGSYTKHRSSYKSSGSSNFSNSFTSPTSPTSVLWYDN